MVTLHIEHSISDFEAWSNAFAQFADARHHAGVRAHLVRQPVDDPNYILIDLDFDTLEAAAAFRDFLHTVVWAVPANAPALTGTPQTMLLESRIVCRRVSNSIGEQAEADEHIELVKSIYEAFVNKNVDAVLAACADDITIDQDPALPWGGHFVGHDGVIQFLIKIASELDTAIEIEHLFRSGDDIVQIGRTRGTVIATGQVIDMAECHVWTVRNNTVQAVRFYVESNEIESNPAQPTPSSQRVVLHDRSVSTPTCPPAGLTSSVTSSSQRS